MIAVPADMPLTTPDSEPMAAIPGEADIHVPPLVPSSKVVVAPTHTTDDPETGKGSGLTLTVVVVKHPVPVSL